MVVSSLVAIVDAIGSEVRWVAAWLAEAYAVGEQRHLRRR